MGKNQKIALTGWPHICAVYQSQMILVRKPIDEDCKLYYYYSKFYFFEKVDGLLCVKNYASMYKFCLTESCVRLNHSENINWQAETLMDRDESHNEKRKRLYKSFISDKYGYLCLGERRRVPVCVLKYARMHFPPPTPTDVMEHRDA